jgi:hypothetical protein
MQPGRLGNAFLPNIITWSLLGKLIGVKLFVDEIIFQDKLSTQTSNRLMPRNT